MFPLSRLRERAGGEGSVGSPLQEQELPSSAFGTFSRKREKGKHVNAFAFFAVSPWVPVV